MTAAGHNATGVNTMNTITVKTVKGYNITRKENERGHFTVILKTIKTSKGQNTIWVDFKTIKAAEAYILNNL